MIKNRYNYLTPSVQDIKGKERLKATAPQSKGYKQKAKRTVSKKKKEKVSKSLTEGRKSILRGHNLRP